MATPHPTVEAAQRLDELPDLLTVSEAAMILRISRSTAYAQAKLYETTGCGLPAIRIGRTLRCPKAELLRLSQLD